MPLTDTFVKNIKPGSGAAGEKHTDGQGLFLLVKEAGKYWRMNYRFAEKRKTLALGVYPAVSLAKARQQRDKARELLAAGDDPGIAKKEDRQAKAAAAAHTFEQVARDWLAKTAAERMTSTQGKVTAWLEKDVFPFIGNLPISTIGPRDVLAALRKMEARGALDSVQRVKQVCGQVFRYAVATGTAERDVTQDLKGALAKATAGHFGAITEPKQLGGLMRSIYAYTGHPCTVAALKLSPLMFVRPGELRSRHRPARSDQARLHRAKCAAVAEQFEAWSQTRCPRECPLFADEHRLRPKCGADTTARPPAGCLARKPVRRSRSPSSCPACPARRSIGASRPLNEFPSWENRCHR